jgi:hypothetical protein
MASVNLVEVIRVICVPKVRRLPTNVDFRAFLRNQTAESIRVPIDKTFDDASALAELIDVLR